MPVMTDPTFDRTLAEVIACPDPARGAAARIVGQWAFGSTGGRLSTSNQLRARPLVHSLGRVARPHPLTTPSKPEPLAGHGDTRPRRAQRPRRPRMEDQASAAHTLSQDRNVRA
jgi:hypothetical protein